MHLGVGTALGLLAGRREPSTAATACQMPHCHGHGQAEMFGPCSTSGGTALAWALVEAAEDIEVAAPIHPSRPPPRLWPTGLHPPPPLCIWGGTWDQASLSRPWSQVSRSGPFWGQEGCCVQTL